MKTVAVCLLGLFLTSCDEPYIPTAPPQPNQTITQTVIIGATPAPVPGATPAPGQGMTPTSAKVTIIGGDGSKLAAPGASVPLTFTRFNGSIEVPGNPNDAVSWTVIGATDRGSPTITDPACGGGGRCVQNYNREVQAGAANTSFSVTAAQGSLEATIVVNVR